MATMKANVFRGVNDIRVEVVPRPEPGVSEALIRVTLTTICGTDLHILRGEYPVRPGRSSVTNRSASSRRSGPV
jgi:alcohol dehydrogenase